MKHTKSIVRPEEGFGPPDERPNRLAMFLTAEDALMVYKALHSREMDGGCDRLKFLIEEHYEEATGERLLEPWEWDDD